MGRRRNQFHNDCFSCDDLNRAGLGSGIAAKVSSFQVIQLQHNSFQQVHNSLFSGQKNSHYRKR